MKNNVKYKIPRSYFSSSMHESKQEGCYEYRIEKMLQKAKPLAAVFKACCKPQKCEIVMSTDKDMNPITTIKLDIEPETLDSIESFEQFLKTLINERCALAQKLNEALIHGNHEAALSFKKDLPSQHKYQDIEKVMTTLSKLPEIQTVLSHGKEKITLQRLVQVSTIINVRIEKTLTVPIDDISFKRSLLTFALGTEKYELSCYPSQLDDIPHYLSKTSHQILKIELVELRIKNNEVFGELINVSLPDS